MTNARPSSMPGATSPRWPAALFVAALSWRGIVLLIAKFERLALNVALVCRPIEVGVEFFTAGLPAVNKLTIHILAAVAQEEVRMTSARMKAAQGAPKARGATLGNPHLRPGTRRQAFAAHRLTAKVITAKARRYSAAMAQVIRLTLAEGATSLAAIAAAMTTRGVSSPSGRGGWHIRSNLNPRSGTNRQQHR